MTTTQTTGGRPELVALRRAGVLNGHIFATHDHECDGCHATLKLAANMPCPKAAPAPGKVTDQTMQAIAAQSSEALFTQVRRGLAAVDAYDWQAARELERRHVEMLAALRDLTGECEAGILNGHSIALARAAIAKAVQS